MFDVFFFNDTATTEIYTLSLHDALPISVVANTTKISASAPLVIHAFAPLRRHPPSTFSARVARPKASRSEEHTSELQSRQYLVCRLLLEKKSTLSTSSEVLMMCTL